MHTQLFAQPSVCPFADLRKHHETVAKTSPKKTKASAEPVASDRPKRKATKVSYKEEGSASEEEKPKKKATKSKKAKKQSEDEEDDE